MMITGMCVPSPAQAPKPETPAAKNNREVCAYFEYLGYRVTEDWSMRTRQCWHEVYGDKGMACQIDKGVPLMAIIQDFVAWHKGGKGSDVDYTVRREEDDAWREVLQRVSDHPTPVYMKQGELPL